MKRFIIIFCAPLLFSLFSFSHEREAVYEVSEPSAVQEKIVYPEVVKLHPPVVHFAVALPLFTLLLEGLYHLRGRKPDEVEFFALLLSSGAVIGAAVTGYIAHESMENLPITPQALELLHTHQTLGIALAGLFSLVFLLRLVYTFKPVPIIHHLYLLLLLTGVAGLLYQGNLGGKLVYNFGLGVSG
ncbi:putative membrane protein [Hydrogenivirga caldilitoris]|uniref:Putative membrane protein n=1 Tax=Hydrogenivirga caldilitoris TaxID=246264 RepID=A0A497XN24_9AQUI|nr:DUF2231 domain-containing protein [Hydrogenivirga caldilitoris]RLJ70325.1 putative membrane protein [Hydrogenivirga caldilitoris]